MYLEVHILIINSMWECNLNDIMMLNSNTVKKKMKYHDIPDEEHWRVSSATELIKIRDKKLEVTGFTQEEIKEMLDYICSS